MGGQWAHKTRHFVAEKCLPAGLLRKFGDDDDRDHGGGDTTIAKIGEVKEGDLWTSYLDGP